MNQAFKIILSILLSLLSLSGCQSEPTQPLRIALNPWPGYEMLFLAKQKGFFKQVGLDVELVRVSSLADTQRAYLNGRVDGLTSTLIEAIQIQAFSIKPLKVVLVTDFSLGGDVIIANKTIKSVADLKGKNVGAPVSSLGIYVLQRGLQSASLSLEDIKVINVEQTSGVKEMNNQRVSAFVTYPPVSVELLKNPNHHIIFDSAQIPKEIVDVISISDTYLNQYPATQTKLWQAWQKAYLYLEQNPDDAKAIMAEQLGLSNEEFSETLSSLQLMSGEQQSSTIEDPFLRSVAKQICNTLLQINSIDKPCDFVSQMFYVSK